MYNIIKFEFYDIQGFITEGKIGMHRVEELVIPKDISLDDILDDLDERYGESLNDQTEFFHSIFVFACVRKKEDQKHFKILKRSSALFGETIETINEICLYLNRHFEDAIGI
ncbi:hypothetical protein ACNF46_011320 [Mammaliicoccus sciuri]|uniref:hypothetical protein n=2 Tax=Mammaliicoccus sciuri TaxID=1296 RepID=UPI00288637B8|nr:hypothetical protein [Mammaliicoccus sciuri]MDT0756159.1 hypothetical protein [Mammaliicoccus sciuri]MEB7817958.1 hypothetical protein [Mammaliicoccus sciuri]